MQFSLSTLDGSLHLADHFFDLFFFAVWRFELADVVEDVEVESRQEGKADRLCKQVRLAQAWALPAAVFGEVLKDDGPLAVAQIVYASDKLRLGQRTDGHRGARLHGESLLRGFGGPIAATAAAAGDYGDANRRRQQSGGPALH